LSDDEVPVSYQIPQTIFLGDKGRLVYPLDAYFFNKCDQVIQLESIAKPDEVVIHRVELSRGRLIIDFQCWKTGTVTLPPVEIAGRIVDGMEVYVSSLIEGKDAVTVLSPAIKPIIAPGTLWIMSGGAAALIVFVACTSFFILRGGNFFAAWRGNARKRRAIRITRKALKKIKLQILKGQITASIALSELLNEFRIFLDEYCGVQCRSLVPDEFLKLSFPAELPSGADSPRYFANFFTRCDTLRFSGAGINTTALNSVINEVETFIKAAALRQ
jgi:hypothetical protein